MFSSHRGPSCSQGRPLETMKLSLPISTFKNGSFQDSNSCKKIKQDGLQTNFNTHRICQQIFTTLFPRLKLPSLVAHWKALFTCSCQDWPKILRFKIFNDLTWPLQHEPKKKLGFHLFNKQLGKKFAQKKTSNTPKLYIQLLDLNQILHAHSGIHHQVGAIRLGAVAPDLGLGHRLVPVKLLGQNLGAFLW